MNPVITFWLAVFDDIMLEIEDNTNDLYEFWGCV